MNKDKGHTRMITTRISTFVLTLLAGTLLLGSAASAHDDDRRDWNPHGSRNHSSYSNDWHNYNDRYNDRNDWKKYERERYSRINLSAREQRELRQRMEREYWRKCSTIAGQRYYDCNPYRQNVTYVVGRPLPHHVTVWNMPYSMHSSLPRPYPGTHYVWVDRDILLVRDHDNSVLDILRMILN